MSTNIIIPSGFSLVSAIPVVAWTPAAITTVGWYDATDAATITSALGAVSQWDDKSGQAHHLVQATPSLQPTTGLNTIGGLNVISSDQDRMSTVLHAGDLPTSLQVTGVIKKTGANTTFEAFFGRTAGNKPAPVDRYLDRIFVGDGSSFSTTTGFTNIRTMTAATLISTLANTTTVKEWLDGTNINDTAHGGTYDDVGTDFTIGSRNDGATTFRGDWGEIVVTVELSDTDRQKLEGYLAWKWGLEGNLPIGHPYKLAVPTV